MIKKIKHFKEWLLNKTPELRQLSLSDALLAKIILDIQRQVSSKVFKAIPLNFILLIHPINRQSALEKIDQRARALLIYKDELLRKGHVSNQVLTGLMPSVSPIRVIPYNDTYLAFEGNGRIATLQKIFVNIDMTVDVELFQIPKDSYLYRDIKKLQELYKKDLL